MKLSAKIRYALAATLRMAQLHRAETSVTVIRLAKDLGISKIYLEQIFSLLKREGIVVSIKGAHGGYLLARPPHKINVHEIVSAVDASLLARNTETVANNAPDITSAIQSAVFVRLDDNVAATLSAITLDALVAETEKYQDADHYMYYL